MPSVPECPAIGYVCGAPRDLPSIVSDGGPAVNGDVGHGGGRGSPVLVLHADDGKPSTIQDDGTTKDPKKLRDNQEQVTRWQRFHYLKRYRRSEVCHLT